MSRARVVRTRTNSFPDSDKSSRSCRYALEPNTLLLPNSIRCRFDFSVSGFFFSPNIRLTRSFTIRASSSTDCSPRIFFKSNTLCTTPRTFVTPAIYGLPIGSGVILSRVQISLMSSTGTAKKPSSNENRSIFFNGLQWAVAVAVPSSLFFLSAL